MPSRICCPGHMGRSRDLPAGPLDHPADPPRSLPAPAPRLPVAPAHPRQPGPAHGADPARVHPGPIMKHRLEGARPDLGGEARRRMRLDSPDPHHRPASSAGMEAPAPTWHAGSKQEAVDTAARSVDAWMEWHLDEVFLGQSQPDQALTRSEVLLVTHCAMSFAARSRPCDRECRKGRRACRRSRR